MMEDGAGLMGGHHQLIMMESEQDCPKSDKDWCVNEADDEESCIYVNLEENRE